jgi:hypothetical protein
MVQRCNRQENGVAPTADLSPRRTQPAPRSRGEAMERSSMGRLRPKPDSNREPREKTRPEAVGRRP